VSKTKLSNSISIGSSSFISGGVRRREAEGRRVLERTERGGGGRRGGVRGGQREV
jgi:hypothetical protein